MNYKTPISLLLSIVVWCAFLSAPAHGAAEEGKFHLVYLVSAEKVEVGAKAYVEPLFLTDGTEIKPVYEYCQALHRGIKNPPQRLIVDREHALESFCQNKAFAVEGKSLVVRGVEGTTVRLGDIAFTRYATGDTTMLAPFMSNTGTAAIKSAAEASRKIMLGQSGWRHFLMASSDELLRSLIPSVAYQPAEYEQLVKRAQAFGERKKGTHSVPDDVRRRAGFKEAPPSPIFGNMQVEIIDALIVDLDRDGRNDMVVGMRAPQSGATGSGETRFVWAGVGLIFANGSDELLSATYQKTNYWYAVRAGAIPSSPLAVFRTASCSYVVYRPKEFYGEIDFRAFGKPGDSCQNKQVMKVYESAMQHD